MAPNAKFDLVAAAEFLLEQAQMLTLVAKTGPEGDELALRRRIAQLAKKIAFETAPPIDVVKSDWVVLANVAAWNLFIDWKAFDYIPLDGYISIADLARAINAQESLVGTPLLHPPPLPHLPLYLTTNPISALATVAVGNGMKPYAHWPAYFRKYGRHRKEVVNEAREKARENGLEGVLMMEHDFHEEQPVKGALVYLLRRVLLDYSDSLATNILRRLADALPADNPRARVIIMEERLLDIPTPQNCIVDLVMLNLGGKLRNSAMFEDIAGRAGLKVVGYHTRDGDPSCVVECAKA
ncbi:hypothetical protein N0V88_007388 [Collariella sp. IMI 366227]|nr:hypothetical protein N0V88_007388 [Collariella sp. IMI 366227]